MVPVKITSCGLPGALSVTRRVPVWVSALLVLNSTAMVQESSAPRLVPQVFDSEKGPVVVMLVMLNSVLPKSLNVGAWFGIHERTGNGSRRKWQEMDTVAGNKVAFGPVTVPVPVKAADCGLPVVLSVIVIDALRGPGWLGVKVTLMVQFAPAARLDSHVLLWLKSAALAPVNAMLLITTSELPVLVRISGCAPLLVPVNCGEAKFKLVAERVRVSGSKTMEIV